MEPVLLLLEDMIEKFMPSMPFPVKRYPDIPLIMACAGFETNPLVINNTIYAGNRDGYFYAFDAVTWKPKMALQNGRTDPFLSCL